LKFELKAFDALTPRQLHAIYQLRVAIFVVEQACAYQEVDDTDLTAQHLCGINTDGQLMAYARLMQESPTTARIGRVLVKPVGRGQGYGRQLMQTAIAQCQQLWPATTQINLQAQVYLDAFYRSLGFVAVSPAYLEDGIPHRNMVLTLTTNELS